jgi:peptide/nickel transport system permease protein
MSATIPPSPATQLRVSHRWDVARLLMQDWHGLASAAFLLTLVFAAIVAPWLAPYSPVEQNLRAVLAEPSHAHWLGTDDLGRDVLSRLIYGVRASLYGCVLATGISIAIGVPIGLAAGFIGGWLDSFVSRTVDALLSFPAIVLAVGVTGVLGPGLTNGMIAVGFTFSPQFARLARAGALVVKSELFVDAARGFGAGPLHILRRHVLPNAAPPLIVYSTLLLSSALLAEASLSFLGLGVQPPQASWGGMLARAYINMESAPGQMYAPGLAILFTAVAFNGLGQSLRTILDPKARNPA